VERPGNWIDAHNATPAGAHLVTFADAAEENWVWNTFLPFIAPNLSVPESDRFRFSIGFTDSDLYGPAEGDWRWITGEAITYLHWGSDEPNACDRKDVFARLIRVNRWIFDA
jgi:hypothetical protein